MIDALGTEDEEAVIIREIPGHLVGPMRAELVRELPGCQVHLVERDGKLWLVVGYNDLPGSELELIFQRLMHGITHDSAGYSIDDELAESQAPACAARNDR